MLNNISAIFSDAGAHAKVTPQPGCDRRSFSRTWISRANDRTFFHIPELRCSLDAGLREGRQVDTVFLTRTHHDHSKDLFLDDSESDRVNRVGHTVWSRLAGGLRGFRRWRGVDELTEHGALSGVAAPAERWRHRVDMLPT
jgi:hypothetical protein